MSVWFVMYQFSTGLLAKLIICDLSCYVFLLVKIFLRAYDGTLNSICFLFIPSCNFYWIAFVTSFLTDFVANLFWSLEWLFFCHTWLTSLSKITCPLVDWFWRTFAEGDKVSWGYCSWILFEAANGNNTCEQIIQLYYFF